MNLRSEAFEKQWFVIYTLSRAEKKVSQRLEEINVEHYLPLKKELRQWKDRKKWVEAVLFPSYIFVFIEDCKRFNLYLIPGFLKYVSFGGKHIVLSGSELEKIERICNYNGLLEISKNEFVAGEEVMITAGYFIGMRGHLLTKGNHNRLRITIGELNCCALVEIEKVFVQKIL